jgi:hypothetical protein
MLSDYSSRLGQCLQPNRTVGKTSLAKVFATITWRTQELPGWLAENSKAMRRGFREGDLCHPSSKGITNITGQQFQLHTRVARQTAPFEGERSIRDFNDLGAWMLQ